MRPFLEEVAYAGACYSPDARVTQYYWEHARRQIEQNKASGTSVFLELHRLLCYHTDILVFFEHFGAGANYLAVEFNFLCCVVRGDVA